MKGQPVVVTVSADRRYPVYIGAGAAGLLEGADWLRGRRVALIHGATVSGVASQVRSHLNAADVVTVTVPDGEPAKSVAVAADCWDALAAAGISRGDVVVSVGGGTVTDLAGFVAATWMRGVDVVHVPTTTAAMVDAAVGGKTGINITAGKNLVGSFHSPLAVYCDLDVLETLPAPDHAAGLAEALKCGFIADRRLLDVFREHGAALRDPTHPALPEIVQRAIAVKAAVVAADFTESAEGIGRELLNYGHTFGHALEQLSGYRMRHGDAVAVGMVFAAEISQGLGLADSAFVAEHRALIAGLGLPTGHDLADSADAVAVMGRDKKARGGVVRFIVLRAQADPLAADGVGRDIIDAAFDRTARA